MATTTVAAIRAQLVTVIEALSPAGLESVKFRRAPRRQDIAEQARKHSGHTRWFAIQAADKPEKQPYVAPDQKQYRESWDLLVVYPVLVSAAGANELDDLEDKVRADMFLIEDAVLSPGNYVSGVNRMDVVSAVIEKTAEVWVANFTIEIDYYVAQTLT